MVLSASHIFLYYRKPENSCFSRGEVRAHLKCAMQDAGNRLGGNRPCAEMLNLYMKKKKLESLAGRDSRNGVVLDGGLWKYDWNFSVALNSSIIDQWNSLWNHKNIKESWFTIGSFRNKMFPFIYLFRRVVFFSR